MAQEILPTPILHHIGLFVKDLEATKEFLFTIPGMSNWRQVEAEIKPEDAIVGAPFRFISAMCELHGVNFELVQPLDSPDSYQAQYMEKNGVGFSHIAYVCPGICYKRTVENMKAKGYKVVWAARLGKLDGGYWAPNDEDGPVIEISDSFPEEHLKYE